MDGILPAENRDHTYLRTKNQIFFCVAGNYHSRKYVYGMPYYFVTEELERILNTRISLFITIEGKKFSKLLDNITLSEYPLFIKKNYKSYYYSPHKWRSLMKVNRSEIEEILDPRGFVKGFLKKGKSKKHNSNPILYLLNQIHSYNPSLIESVGITGSVLLTKDIEHFGNDIDLVFYGCNSIQAVKEFSITMCRENSRIAPLRGKLLKEYVKKKINRFPGTEKELTQLVKGRWDTIFVDGIKADFTFCNDDTETVMPYNVPRLQTCTIRAKITDISESYFLPTVLGIDDPRFKKVIITARGYICLFKLNDKVKIQGAIHYSEKKQKEFLVVDELAGGSVVFLD